MSTARKAISKIRPVTSTTSSSAVSPQGIPPACDFAVGTVRAPVFVLDVSEAGKQSAGNAVKIKPDTSHYMSQEQPTPALVVWSKDDVQIGVLTSYYLAPKVYAWTVNPIYQVTVEATVASVTVDAEVSMYLNLRIWMPSRMVVLYAPRMTWALSDEFKVLYGKDALQEPPPEWQIACLRDYNLTTALAGETNWTEELDTLDIYTGTVARTLPAYTGPVPTQTALYAHQSQALQWAIEQENPAKPTTQSAVQLWRYHQQRKVFVHTMLNIPVNPNQLLLGRGGLLADDMGLGKTLTMIALIAVTQSEPITQYQNSTLIVAPLSVLSTWEEEISLHCKTLTYLIYHPAGGRGRQPASNFRTHDVVITNYDTLRRKDDLLFSISWRRVILDEAHHIRNPDTQIHKAVLLLRAHARWALTGTPIINSLYDVQSLVAFLKTCEPMAAPRNWDLCIGSGKKLVKNGTNQLKQLLQCFCLHRTKEMRDENGQQILALPKVSYRTINITMGSKQQKVYDEVATSGKRHLESGGGPNVNLLTMILRLRQVVLHPTLVPATSQTRWGDTLTNASMCFECMEAIAGEDVRRCTKQQHSICSKCAGRNCPCGSPIDPQTYTAEEYDSESIPSPENGIESAKLDALVVMLKQTSAADKCLVFSSFVKFLRIVEHRLIGEGIGCLLYHGQMTADERTANVQKFKTCSVTEPGAPRVMLLSLAAGAFGLNLTVANNVFLMDPWWQPSIERQAIDRVNRMGQTKEVIVYRLVAAGTIEQKVLDIQASKSALIRTALSDTKSAGSPAQGDFQVWTQTQPQEKRNLLLSAL